MGSFPETYNDLKSCYPALFCFPCIDFGVFLNASDDVTFVQDS